MSGLSVQCLHLSESAGEYQTHVSFAGKGIFVTSKMRFCLVGLATKFMLRGLLFPPFQYRSFLLLLSRSSHSPRTPSPTGGFTPLAQACSCASSSTQALALFYFALHPDLVLGRTPTGGGGRGEVSQDGSAIVLLFPR